MVMCWEFLSMNVCVTWYIRKDVCGVMPLENLKSKFSFHHLDPDFIN